MYPYQYFKIFKKIPNYYLGLAGFLPISPLTYRVSWRNREELRYKIDLKEKTRQEWMEKQQKPIEEESEQQ